MYCNEDINQEPFCTMSSPVIFSSVCGILAQSFVDKMPSHVNKVEFFDNTCKDHKLTFSHSDSNYMFSVEGQWNDIRSVEELLQRLLQDWHLELAPKAANLSDKSCAVSATSKSQALRDPVSVSFEKNIDLNVQSDVELTTSQSVVSEIEESQQQTSESVETEGVHCIEQNENSCNCDGGNNTNSDGMCLDKSSVDHENEIYLDIQLSCRPQNGLFNESGISPASVVMGTEKSLMEAVCFESSHNEGLSNQHVAESNNLRKESSNINSKIIRSRMYEKKAMFKYFCTQCSFKSKRQSHFKKHAVLHEQVCKLYSCDHCDFSTIRLGHLKRHVLQHSESPLTCPTCNFRTDSKSLLQKHQNLKHKPNKISNEEQKSMRQCSECDYSTTKEKLFQRHQTVHSTDKHVTNGKKKCFECNKCPFTATVKSNLARHFRNVHVDDRPFLCNVCGQGFKRSDTLTQHLVVHAGNDSSMSELQCVHCQKFYRSKTLLHEHMLVHADTRLYLCETCGAAFKTRAVQRKHVRQVHANSKISSCSLCPRKFNSQYAVKRHMKLHELKIAREPSPKLTLKSAKSSTTEATDQWESSVMTVPLHEDVQVFVVQQDDVEQGVVFNEGAVLVPAKVQMESTSDLSTAVNVPVLPVEYVLPNGVASEVCTTADLSDQFSLQDGEIITLQFVQ